MHIQKTEVGFKVFTKEAAPAPKRRRRKHVTPRVTSTWHRRSGTFLATPCHERSTSRIYREGLGLQALVSREQEVIRVAEHLELMGSLGPDFVRAAVARLAPAVIPVLTAGSKGMKHARKNRRQTMRRVALKAALTVAFAGTFVPVARLAFH